MDSDDTPAAPPAWVYSYNAGVEVEAAGRTPAKNWMALRRDLAALPWVLAGPHDVVIAPPQRPAFLAALRAAGAHGLPAFLPSVPCGRAIAGHRPYGVPGAHLRRSLVARCRDDVAVCRTGDEVRAAVARLGRPATVLKTEYSAAGFGVRVCDGGAASLVAGAPPYPYPYTYPYRDRYRYPYPCPCPYPYP